MNKYKIGKYELDIPLNFALPDYQKSLKLYDRFLPVLAKHLSSHKLLIDVGANIGDTTIAMIQHCDNPILCIEPSDVFLPFLETNLKTMSAVDQSRVAVSKTLVGTGRISGALHHIRGGTASLDLARKSEDVTHVPLDALVGDVSGVILLKVDTDGFDFDVIESAGDILANSEPVLYWENEISHDFQYQGFSDMYPKLAQKGYKYIYIFDNFGNLIAEEATFETLKCLNAYVYSMLKHNCTRTFYYTDILASTDRHHVLIGKAVDEYKSDWINR